MYLYAENAMRRRMNLEAPTCAVRTMQQPGLGNGNYVSLGALSDYNVTVGSTTINIPMVIGAIALLGVLMTLIRRRKKGRARGKGLVRRTTTTFAAQ